MRRVLEFSAESYRTAALEHLSAAEQLHEDERYALSHYLAGLAVECMLRAYLRRNSAEWYPDHNVDTLASRSRFFEIVPVELRLVYGSKITDINRRWRSNHRFYTGKQLYSYLSEIRADFGVKGDRCKQNSRSLLNLAIDIIQMGQAKWTQSNSENE